MPGYTIYKKTDRKPLPRGAQILHRKGSQYARWTDTRGRVHTAPLTEEGTTVLVERKSYYIDHDGPDGRRVTVKGYTDKEATEQLAARLQKDAERVRVGLAPRADLARAQVPWREARDLWLAGMRHDNLDDVYIDNCSRLLTKLADACGWTTLASIRKDRVEGWLRDIKTNGVPDKDGKRKARLPSDRTIDQYTETARRFVKWCCAQEPPYLDENPLAGLRKIRRPKRARRRRAFTEDELQKLLAVAGERAPLYKLAALTGLRKDELRRLLWADCRLDAPKPYIQLRPEANKARREDRIPLHSTAVNLLRHLRDGAGERSTVFAGVPRPNTFRRDLMRAKIPYLDNDGKIADFHALRYSFGTMLAKANVPIRTAMSLMRHKDPKLTLMIYVDSGQLDLDEAISRLPDLDAARKKKRNPGRDKTPAAPAGTPPAEPAAQPPQLNRSEKKRVREWGEPEV
jgi:integrase